MGNILKKYNLTKTQWEVVGGAITGDTLPIGAIIPFGGTEAPTGWLICDGSMLNRETYKELFAAIGTNFGTDGPGNFYIPDLRGKVAVGQDTTDSDFGMGLTGGEKTHTLTVNEMPSHNHLRDIENIIVDSGSGGAWSPSLKGTGNMTGENNSTRNTGGGQPHNNLQPYIVTNYIIKAFQSSGVVAQVSNTKSDSTTDTYSCDYINEKVDTVESDTQTVGFWTIGCKKVGKITQINVLLTGSLNINGFTTITIGTLADKFKPLMKTPLSGLTHGQTNEQLYVDTNGKIEIFNWGNEVNLTAGEIHVTATYISA